MDYTDWVSLYCQAYTDFRPHQCDQSWNHTYYWGWIVQSWPAGPWLDQSFLQWNRLFRRVFFMKCHFLCAYYLGFDWTDWVIFIKSEIIITAGKGLAGQFWQMESAPSLCNGVFTDQVIFSIILEHFFSDYGSTVPYACASIIRIITNKKIKGYQKIRNTLYLVSGFLKTDL